VQRQFERYLIGVTTRLRFLRAAGGASRANGDRFARLDQSFPERLREGFQQIAAADPQRCVVIDASGDVESVHRAVLAAVAERLGVALSP
jgi:dTMP kinase